MPKRGRRRKKSRTHVVENENNAATALATNEELKVPKTLVIRRGRCEAEVGELVRNLRHMMMPFTALHFQDDAASHQHATLSRYVKNLALPMGITHMLVFSQSTTKQHAVEEEGKSQSPPLPNSTTQIPPTVTTTTTTSHLNLRLVKTPQGPTLWFRVHQFSLNRHIHAIQKRPYQLSTEVSQHPPIVVTNNFGSSGNSTTSAAAGAAGADGSTANNASPHIKLMRITFQNMFPAINVATVSLSSCRRVVLFHLVEESDPNDPNNNKKRQLVQVRHFAIKTSTPKSVQNRRVQRLLHPTKTFPNLHQVQDIADYIVGQSHGGGSSSGSIGSGAMMSVSDSEMSDDEDQVEVVLPDDGTDTPQQRPPVSRKKSKSNKHNNSTTDAASTASTTTSRTSSASSTASSSRSSVLKLVELGPRLTLELIKVEKGLESQGSVVLYHAHVHKRPEEVRALQQRHEQRALLKRQRQAVQQANVERKQRESKKQKEGGNEGEKRKRKNEQEGDVDDGDGLDEEVYEDDDGDYDDMDDGEGIEEREDEDDNLE